MRICFLFLALVFFGSTDAYIGRANSMRGVVEYFEDTGPETLAVFDIDMVLLQPEHPAFQMVNMLRFRSYVTKCLEELGKEKTELFFNLVGTSYDSILVDDRTPYLLSTLKAGKVPTIAFTASLTGPFNEIEDPLEWKVNRLKKFDINFEQGAPCSEEIIFKEFPFRNSYASYKKGVLSSNGQEKGNIFVKFLEISKIYPQKVVFIDDREENLLSVEKALAQYDPSIIFYGVHFLGAINYNSDQISELEFVAAWEDMLSKMTSLTKCAEF